LPSVSTTSPALLSQVWVLRGYPIGGGGGWEGGPGRTQEHSGVAGVAKVKCRWQREKQHHPVTRGGCVGSGRIFSMCTNACACGTYMCGRQMGQGGWQQGDRVGGGAGIVGNPPTALTCWARGPNRPWSGSPPPRTSGAGPHHPPRPSPLTAARRLLVLV
jgi:hypothetical protein